MTFVEAKTTAAKLFGPGLKLHRGKNRCFIIRDGMPIGDGRSWLEALRSAGEMQMAKNAMNDAEAIRVKKMLEVFRAEYPDINPEKELTKEELDIFDEFVSGYELKAEQDKPHPGTGKLLSAKPINTKNPGEPLVKLT